MTMQNTPAATLTFTLQDASGSKAPFAINVPFATLASVALAAADVLRPLIAVMTDCVIVAQSLTYSYADDNPGSPVAGSRVEEKAVFVWRTANARSTRMSIPAIKDTQLNASGSVNRAAVATAAFILAVEDVDAIFCGADGSDVTSLLSAYQRFRSSTKNMLPADR